MESYFPIFEAILKKEIGLDTVTIGRETVLQIIKRRMKSCGHNDPHVYLQLLQQSRDEFDELLEEIVVPETWFFRDQKSFEYLQGYAEKLGPLEAIRILSVPCSSGEEAYSIVLALMEARVAPAAIHVDAADVSQKALAKARAGIYGKNSFRGTTSISLKETDGRYAIDPQVTECVHFFYGNILKEFLPRQKNIYDVIFFRNLLIYMTEEARSAAIETVDRLLKAGGLLFVGHAESSVVRSQRLRPDGPPGAFAFRKIAADSKTESEQTAAKMLPPKTPQIKMPKPGPSVTPKVSIRKDEHQLLMIKARQAADEGKLAESESLCNQLIEQHGSSADVYSLLGLIELSKGNNRMAEDFFLKSLYLNPSHYEALIHLSLLKEHQGDPAAASIFKRRADRLEVKNH